MYVYFPYYALLRARISLVYFTPCHATTFTRKKVNNAQMRMCFTLRLFSFLVAYEYTHMHISMYVCKYSFMNAPKFQAMKAINGQAQSQAFICRYFWSVQVALLVVIVGVEYKNIAINVIKL